jgi:hypothetical protein
MVTQVCERADNFLGLGSRDPSRGHASATESLRATVRMRHWALIPVLIGVLIPVLIWVLIPLLVEIVAQVLVGYYGSHAYSVARRRRDRARDKRVADEWWKPVALTIARKTGRPLDDVDWGDILTAPRAYSAAERPFDYHFFVSYTTREEEVEEVLFIIDEFVRILKRFGLRAARVFFDRFSIGRLDGTSENLAKCLREAIHKSVCMIAFVSPGYIESDWCMFEWMDGWRWESITRTLFVCCP